MIISRPSSGTSGALVLALAARLIAPGSVALVWVSRSYLDRKVVMPPPFGCASHARPHRERRWCGVCCSLADARSLVNLFQQGPDFVGGGHGGRALTASGDQGAGAVGEPQDLFQVPAFEQAVAE